jgi:tungstate transport system permease protein
MQNWPGILKAACSLIWHGDPWLLGLVGRSLQISLAATLLAAFVGLPLAGALAAARPKIRAVVVPMVRVGAMLPAVSVGLCTAFLFAPRGAPSAGMWRLGAPFAVGCGQGILALLVVVALAEPVLHAARVRLLKTVWTLGAAPAHAWLLLAGEARRGLGAAVVAGFARVVGEAGSALVLGGGGLTFAAAVATQAEQQAWSRAVALGITLTMLALLAGALWVRWRDEAG